MQNDIFAQLNKAKEHVRLTQKEHDFHRGEIIKFIGTHRGKVASPYMSFFFHRHFVVTTLASLLFFVTGLTLSAEGSLPNDYLYTVKTKISEPIISWLTPTVAGKARFGVTLVGRRLNELSQITLQDGLKEEEKIEFAQNLALQVENTQTEIKTLIENNETSDAAESANKLKSVLSAHNIILQKIEDSSEENKKEEDWSVDINNDINKSLESTNAIVSTLTTRVKSSEDTVVEETTIEQKDEIERELAEIKEDIEYAKEHGWELAPGDEHYIEVEFARINTLLLLANKEEVEGNQREVFVVYSQIDQRIEEMKSLIEADQELGVDVIGDLVPFAKDGSITEEAPEEIKNTIDE